MDRMRDSLNSMNDETSILIESQPITGHAMHPNTSVSYDSGIGIGMNIRVNRMTGMDSPNGSNYDISVTEIMLRRLHLRSLPSDESSDTGDENKENISPILEPTHNVRASTPIHRDPQSVGTENIVRIFSRPILNEQERERTPSGSSPVGSESVVLRSPLHFSNLSPIRATPRHSPVRRRIRTVTTEEAVDSVSLEDLPEISPFGPNGTPPRTPSPMSFAEIHNDSGHGNSNEVTINEPSANERSMIMEVADMTTSADFVTPPSRPPLPPMAPRKKKMDKSSVRAIDSPSFFPKTTVRLGLKESRFMPSPTNSNISSMVLRSALKPRRSTRIKRMPNRYSIDHRSDLHKKPRKI